MAPSDANPVVNRARTVGVEEEFLLVPATSRETVPRAARVLERAGRRGLAAPDAALHPELLSSQVEAATGTCTSLRSLRYQITRARGQLGNAARADGNRLVSCGTPVLCSETVPVTDGERFARVASTYAGMVRDYQACGCHVHVGVPDRETAIGILKHLRPWLPTLLAISANSPFHEGADTGYASWRVVQQSRFPGSGVPPRCASAAEYDEQVARLVDCGVLVDRAMSFWFARPSPRLPTVELRVADAATTPDEAILQAALTRALVNTALHQLEICREGAQVPDQVAAAATWSAARYGLRGPAIHPIHGLSLPATDLVEELLQHVVRPWRSATNWP